MEEIRIPISWIEKWADKKLDADYINYIRKCNYDPDTIVKECLESMINDYLESEVVD